MARARVTITGHTIDPSQIQDPSEIPPSGAQFAGSSAKRMVDVYYGTVSGDTDAQPAAKELLGTAADTGGCPMPITFTARSRRFTAWWTCPVSRVRLQIVSNQLRSFPGAITEATEHFTSRGGPRRISTGL